LLDESRMIAVLKFVFGTPHKMPVGFGALANLLANLFR
jgi:hypothetical protein